ncbi:hypothetical protein ACSQ67_010806 [Phaseolus vulgaris]
MTMSLPICLATTQTPSRSSSQLVGDANKHHTPCRPHNFQPSPFTHEFIQSLENKFVIETLQERATKLEEKVRVQMNGTDMEPLSLLEFIDDIERLGPSFKFEEEINKTLLKIVSIENFEDRTGKVRMKLLFFLEFSDDMALMSRKISRIIYLVVGNYSRTSICYPSKELTKVGQLLTILDDVYDIYGTIDELELFTDAIERWNVNSINTLPDNLVLCFLAIYNTVNGMAYDIFKERGIKCLPYLTKSWSDLCKAYLQEVKWFYNKIIPPFNEFLQNARISITGVVVLTHSYFLISKDITEQVLHSITNLHDLLSSSFTIIRLVDDLATSTVILTLFGKLIS